MSKRLPWWMIVILESVVIAALAVEYFWGALIVLFSGENAYSYTASAAYLTWLGGAAITLVLIVAIGFRVHSIARARHLGRSFAGATLLLSSTLLVLLTFFSPLGWLFVMWNAWYAVYELLRRFIG